MTTMTLMFIIFRMYKTRTQMGGLTIATLAKSEAEKCDIPRNTYSLTKLRCLPFGHNCNHLPAKKKGKYN